MSMRYDVNGNAASLCTLFLILWVLVFLFFFLIGFSFYSFLFTVEQAN